MAFRHYAETTEIIVPTATNLWTEYDLTSHGIPPSAVMEVAVNALRLSSPVFAGVRATSGTLDRRIDIVRSVDGDSFVTMHVQVDENRKIEYFAESTTEVQFNIVGYWVGCEYFERFDTFTPTGSAAWESKALDTYGISGGEIVDVTITNTDSTLSNEVGVRASGSARTRLFDMSRSANLGESCLSQWIQASGATAAIDVYAEIHTECNVYVLGYFNVPPGDYTEADVFLPEPSVDATWETVDVGASGIPASSVASVLMGQDVTDNQFIGVRSTSSSVDRFVNLEESFGDIGLSWVQMAVNVDSSGNIQHYAFDISPDEPQFIITNYWDNFVDSVDPFVHARSVEMFIEGRDPFVHYVEGVTGVFNVTSTDTWQEYDLLLNKEVPASTERDPVVAEILIGNQQTAVSYSGGVRSVGSSLERKFGLRLPTAGGYDFLTMLVPVSSGGKIEIYGGHASFVDFVLLGYWVGASYVEEMEEFSVGADGTWTNVNLGTDYASTIAEVVISNANTSIQQSGGIRQVGSAINRYHSMSPGVTNFPDHTSLHVNTSGVNGTIQGYATTDADITLTAIGRWSTTPGIYNEAFEVFADTTFNNTWQVRDVTVPDGSVAEVVIEHRDDNAERNYGIRESGSSANRLYSLRQTNVSPTDTCADTYRTSVNIVNSSAELHTNFRTDEHDFMTVGYWDSLNFISGDPIQTTGNFDLYVEGAAPVVSGNHDLYIGGSAGAQIIADFDLFMSAPEAASGQFPLFIESRVTFDSSGNYPSGLEMFSEGHLTVSGSMDMFTVGPLLSTGQMTLYTQAGSFDNMPLFIHGVFVKARIRDLYIKGPEFITTSGNFEWQPSEDQSLFTTPSGGQSPDLYIKGPLQVTSSGDLFVDAHLPFSGSMTLYIGPLPARQSWTMFVKTESSTATGSANLFTHGFVPASGQSGVNQAFNNMPLYLEAIDADFPYTAGGTQSWSMFLRVGSGNVSQDQNWSMFLKADTTTSGSFSLVTYGHASGSPPHGNEFSGSMPLVCSVDPSDPGRIGYIPHEAQDPWTLFVRVQQGLFNTTNLYISGAAPTTLFASGTLFIEGLFGQPSGTVPLYILGISGSVNNGPSGLPLFLNAAVGVYNTSGNLYIHGY